MSEVTKTYYTNLRAANIARSKEWGKVSLTFRGSELAGEIGETIEKALDLLLMAVTAGRLANIIKKLERERLGLRGSRATPEELADELADISITADLVGMDMDIDIPSATRRKFNETSEKLGLATRLIAPPAVMLGSEVKIVADRNDYGYGTLKVVSMSIDPAGQIWCSVAELDAKHHGFGVYDGETTDIQIEHLELVDNGKG